jgi:hypothetical protein
MKILSKEKTLSNNVSHATKEICAPQHVTKAIEGIAFNSLFPILLNEITLNNGSYWLTYQ